MGSLGPYSRSEIENQNFFLRKTDKLMHPPLVSVLRDIYFVTFKQRDHIARSDRIDKLIERQRTRGRVMIPDLESTMGSKCECKVRFSSNFNNEN